MASVSWEYPRDRMLALQRQAQAASAAAPVDTGLALENLRFRYAISGSSPSWKPLRAFDDGQKVYIQFPAGIAQGELPPLFVIGPEGDGQLVNYRFRSPYYIVDRRSEEHTSELQSLLRISYAVFCLKTKTHKSK